MDPVTILCIAAVVLIPVGFYLGMGTARMLAVKDFIFGAVDALKDGKLTSEECDKLIQLAKSIFESK